MRLFFFFTFRRDIGRGIQKSWPKSCRCCGNHSTCLFRRALKNDCSKDNEGNGSAGYTDIPTSIVCSVAKDGVSRLKGA